MSNDWAPPTPPIPQPPLLGEYAQPEPPRSSKRAKVAVAALSVAALLAGGGFAAIALTGASSDGGAGSPEEAVAALMGAIASEDSLGALDALAPAERNLVLDAFTDVPAELRRLGLWGEGGETWADVSFDGLTYATEDLRDGVAIVEITGGVASVAYDWSKLPVGESIVEELLGGEMPTGSGVESDPVPTDDPLRIAVVRRDGGWYVSAFTTIAEIARDEAGLELPAEPIPALGSDTPEAAVTAMVDALASTDARAVIELLPPDEMAVLHDYGPLLIDEIEPSEALTVERLVLGEPSVDGDTARVPITELAGSVELDGEVVAFEFADGCVRTEATDFDGEPLISEQCNEDLARQAMVTAVREDGEWYVSPVRSIVDAMVEALRASEPGEVEDALSGLGDLFFFGFGRGAEPGIDPFASPVDLVADACSADTEWPTEMSVDDFYAEVRACVLAQGFTEDELPAWLYP
jgi:hypothetical protein